MLPPKGATVRADDELLALIAAREAAVHRGTPSFP